MPGSLYLGCGDAADEEPLWRSMLDRSCTKIVYWPFALPPGLCATADRWLRGNLDQLGVGYQLDTWQSLADHVPGELTPENVDLLFVGGGNTFQLLDQVRRHGFIQPTRDFWRAGGDYYGGSAGAVLACDTIDIADGLDPNECGLEDLRSLGLLSGVAILPHFIEQQLGTARNWAIDHGTPVWGLPESIGLQHNGAAVTVFGAGHLTLIDVDGAEQTARSGDSFGFPLTDQQTGPSRCE